jgi:hypothetical protein
MIARSDMNSNLLLLPAVLVSVALIYLAHRKALALRPAPPEAPLPRTDPAVLFCYWGDENYLRGDAATFEHVADHTNLAVLGTWACDANTVISWHVIQMRAGIAAGIWAFCNTIDVLVYSQQPEGQPWQINPNAEANLRAYFTALATAGGLSNYVIALLPVDEPGGGRLTEDQVVQTNALIRRVCTELLGRCPKLVGTSSGVTAALPGFLDYDVIAPDDYDRGEKILAQIEAILPALRPGQQIGLIPGGFDPFRQDPTPFYNWAQRHPGVVWAILAFAWFDVDARAGIARNGMSNVYRTIGRLCCGK